MKRCTLFLSDAGPVNSLGLPIGLDLLLALDMRIAVVDAVYDELTGDLAYLKDRHVKHFIDGHQPPFIIEPTEIGTTQREDAARGTS